MKEWVKSGEPWIWGTAGGLAVALVLVFGVLWLTAARGLIYFWPSQVVETTFVEKDGSKIRLIGEIKEEEEVAVRRLVESGFKIPGNEQFTTRYLLKLGNRDISGFDFKWYPAPLLTKLIYPKDLLTVERREWGNFYGYLKSVRENGIVVAEGDAAMHELEMRVERAHGLFDEIFRTEKKDIGNVNYELEQLRLKERQLQLGGKFDDGAKKGIEKKR